MKKLHSFLLPAALCGSLFFGACKGGADAFMGKWKSADSVTREALDNDAVGNKLVVEKIKDKYAVYPESSPDDSLVYHYDEKADQLVANHNKAIFYIRKDKQTGHLVLTVEGFPDRRLELEKTE